MSDLDARRWAGSTHAPRRLVGPGEGDAIGLGMTRRIGSADTRGALSIYDAVVPPGAFVPPHVHAREDEHTHVVEGEVHFLIGDDHLVARAGAWVLKPRGVAHAFWNPGPAPARVVEIVSPGNLDGYFEVLAQIALDPRLDPARRREALERHNAAYGIRFDDDLARSLSARHGLALPGQ